MSSGLSFSSFTQIRILLLFVMKGIFCFRFFHQISITKQRFHIHQVFNPFFSYSRSFSNDTNSFITTNHIESETNKKVDEEKSIKNNSPQSTLSNSHRNNNIDSNRGSQLKTQSLIDKYFHNGRYPSEEDMLVIEERQLCHKTTNTFAVPKSPCQYGFPQAFVQLPLGMKISSGMVRLSCPYLVKIIDKLESSDTGINYLNSILNDPIKGAELRENFLSVNHIWKNLRNESITDEERKRIVSKEGGENLINAGIIGITPTKVDDVKCFHAHVADHLVRGHNSIGEYVLQIIQSQGQHTKGCSDCWQQCDRKFTPTPTSWWYTPQKNKQKLKVQKDRRRKHKTMNKISKSSKNIRYDDMIEPM